MAFCAYLFAFVTLLELITKKLDPCICFIHTLDKVERKQDWSEKSSIEYFAKTEKFLSYNNLMGRLNNQIVAFVSATYWAENCGRTVIFPGWEEHIPIDSRRSQRLGIYLFEKYFDYGFFKSKYPSVVQFMEYERSIYPNINPRDKKSRLDIPNVRFNATFTKHQLLSLLRGENSVHMVIGSPYWWRFPEKDYERLLSFFRPVHGLLDLAENWIKTNLRKPYFSIHLRRREGLCKLPIEIIAKNIGSNPSLARMKSSFIASDGQDLAGERLLITSFNSSKFDDKLLNFGIYASGIIDGYILGASSLVFANWHSDLSRNWIRNRKGLCSRTCLGMSCQNNESSAISDEIRRVQSICSTNFEVVMLKPLNLKQWC